MQKKNEVMDLKIEINRENQWNQKIWFFDKM